MRIIRVDLVGLPIGVVEFNQFGVGGKLDGKVFEATL